MVNTVDTVNAVTTGNVAPRAVASKPAAPAKDIAADVQAASAKVDDGVPPQPISPRITQDAIAGAIVTQFSNGDGEVTQQVPSQAALAYLRAGLTAQGTPKEDVTGKKEG